MYTLEDLEEAEKELKQWKNRFGNDSSSNINKFTAQIRDAGIRVRRIEEYLKKKEIIEKSPQEILNDELDAIYPNAKSKTIVEHKGQKYQVRYFPLVQSRSRKTVHEWGHNWELLK